MQTLEMAGLACDVGLALLESTVHPHHRRAVTSSTPATRAQAALTHSLTTSVFAASECMPKSCAVKEEPRKARRPRRQPCRFRQEIGRVSASCDCLNAAKHVQPFAFAFTFTFTLSAFPFTDPTTTSHLDSRRKNRIPYR
jgi:hypothetical protein